jgi:hypothetical protein
MTMLEINEKDVQSLQQYAALGMDQEGESQRYPAIQLQQYTGLTPKSAVFWCFSDESISLISDDSKNKLKLEKFEAYFGDDEATLWKINAEIKFIPLFIPKIFKWNKNTNEISHNDRKSFNFKEGDRTIAKCFFLLIADGQLTDTLCTLKLKSFRTEEVIGGKKANEGTLKSLSSELFKRGIGVKGKSNIHFVNIAITPGVKKYQNANGDSSFGAYYTLTKASLNTPQNMVFISELLGDTQLQNDILDPFGLDEEKPITNTNVLSDEELADISF